jgi:peptidyl-prolyl cis-trans isomerase SurA
MFAGKLLAAVLAGLLVAVASSAAAPPGDTLKDRILAVVDEDPILASDLDRAIGLGLAAKNAGETDSAYRRRALNQLIDERLRFHEIERFGFEQVPVDEIEKQVEKIRAGFPDAAAFDRHLKEVGLSPAQLRQLVTRQLLVLTYVDERVGARVFVSQEDIRAYYDDVLTQEMKQQKQPVPPLEEVREQIRNILRDQRLNEEIDRWTRELRDRAEIANYFDQPQKPLPPVVKRIEKKPAQR